jgi:hypothetical protein
VQRGRGDMRADRGLQRVVRPRYRAARPELFGDLGEAGGARGDKPETGDEVQQQPGRRRQTVPHAPHLPPQAAQPAQAASSKATSVTA